MISVRSSEISSKSGQILAYAARLGTDLVDFSKIRWISVEFDVILQISTPTKNRPVSGEVWLSESNLLPIDGRSRNGRLEVIESVPGWAQTQPEPTRGQAYLHMKESIRIKVKWLNVPFPISLNFGTS